MGLIKRVAEGDSAALGKLYREYNTSVFRIALSILEDFQLAEDVTQETFIKIQKNAINYRMTDGEKAWIITIAHNTAIDVLRKRKRETLHKDGFVIDEKVYGMESNLEFLSMLEPISEMNRRIVCLRISSGLRFKDIAKIMALSTGAVKKRYKRALDEIKRSMERE